LPILFLACILVDPGRPGSLAVQHPALTYLSSLTFQVN